jgi:feruloyl esterase
MRSLQIALVAGTVLSGWAMQSPGGPAPAAPMPCENLTSLRLAGGRVTLAQTIAPGGFTLPTAGRGTSPNFSDLPAFCRVAATLTPSSDSDIRIEVWLAAAWNGKFQGVGNGGFAGTISYAAMADALRRGYATGSTDTGHSTAGAGFALGHPEKLIDFGYRSIHEMTLAARSIVDAYYGRSARFSYFNGCSTGGRQALQEAQRFPSDYNGIIAGAAPHIGTRTLSGVVWVGQSALKDPANAIPASKYPMIHKAVLDACDALDGVKDGLIENPAVCRFDPGVLRCPSTALRASDQASCLTAAQVSTALKILPPNPRTGSEVFYGLEPGAELGWGGLTGGPEPNRDGVDQFKYIVYENPNWDWRTFDARVDPARAENAYGGIINASDPNLRPFVYHGGKLLTYHGWADATIPSRASVAYYESVQDTMGGPSKTADWYRMFMVPGMGHCRGGEGPNTFDTVSALEQWVENGRAPERIVASHSRDGRVDRTRPLCPYPQVARYDGRGSIDDAASFTCRVP